MEVNEVVQVMEVWWDGGWCCVAAMPILALWLTTTTCAQPQVYIPRGNPHSAATLGEIWR